MAGKRLTDEEKELICRLYFVEKRSQNFISAKVQRGKGSVNRVIKERMATRAQKPKLLVRPTDGIARHDAAGGAGSSEGKTLEELSLNNRDVNLPHRAYRARLPANSSSTSLHESMPGTRKFKTNAELLRHILQSVWGIDISGIEPFIDIFVRMEPGWLMEPSCLRNALIFRFGNLPGEAAFYYFQLLQPKCVQRW